MDKKMTLKEELAIFKNVNSANKKNQDGHTNFIGGSQEKDVIKNQGISRGKLRNFIESEGGDIDAWKNI